MAPRPALRRALRRAAPWAIVGAGFVLTLAGNAIGGLALVLAGFTARAAIQAADRRDRLQRLLDGVTVADAMVTESPTVPPHMTVDTFAPDLDDAAEPGVVRVVADGRLVGILGRREIAKVPRRRWATVRAGEAMASTASLPGLAPGEPLGPAAERLGATGATAVPVLQDGEPVGVLTRFGVGRILQERLIAAGERPLRDGPAGWGR